MKWNRKKAKGRDVIDIRGASPSSGGSGGGGISMPGGMAGLGGGAGIVVVIVIVAIQLLGGGGSSSGTGFSIDDIFAPGAGAPGADDPQPIPEGQDPQAELKDFSDYVFGDVQDVWTEIFRQSGDDYERAELVLYSGAVSTGGCGNATSAVGPFYCPADQRVYLDLSFYEDMRRQLKAPGDFAWAYVIAHEVGHHVQNLSGTNQQVAELERENPDDAQRALGPDRAPGRLLLGRLGEHGVRRGRPRAGRHRRGVHRLGGGRRRPAAVAGRRQRQPGLVHPRDLRAAPHLVHEGLRVGRPEHLRHVLRYGSLAPWRSRRSRSTISAKWGSATSSSGAGSARARFRASSTEVETLGSFASSEGQPVIGKQVAGGAPQVWGGGMGALEGLAALPAMFESLKQLQHLGPQIQQAIESGQFTQNPDGSIQFTGTGIGGVAQFGSVNDRRRRLPDESTCAAAACARRSARS